MHPSTSSLEYDSTSRIGGPRVAGTDHRWVGPGGVFVPSVKCLHSHYAHYRSQLSSSNTGHDGDGRVVLNMVGKWTHELLLECFPEILL